MEFQSREVEGNTEKPISQVPVNLASWPDAIRRRTPSDSEDGKCWAEFVEREGPCVMPWTDDLKELYK